ncbi:hypothetical protein GLYMA_18G210950v4 [Glycine max]|nr:hypothetical protein GLYMA_18G210950v4 [Glycine max]KAH1155438.1 hypothetical protein GYH30_050659 [Glycine max]
MMPPFSIVFNRLFFFWPAMISSFSLYSSVQFHFDGRNWKNHFADDASFLFTTNH